MRRLFFFSEPNFQRASVAQLGIGRSLIDGFRVRPISYLWFYNHFGQNLIISKNLEKRVHEHIWPHCGMMKRPIVSRQIPKLMKGGKKGHI